MNFLEYASAMVGCYAAMPLEERAALRRWEAENVTGTGRFGTSDWPGWKNYIGRFEPGVRSARDSSGYVYLIQAASGECKIGMAQNAEKRIANLQTANPQILKLVHHFPAADMRSVEAELHQRFAAKCIRNEWYALSDEDIAIFRAVGAKSARANRED